jgi:hypothetical protein
MRYTIKESQYKRLIKLISEQEEEATTAQTSGATITKAASYGDISKVAGSETDQVAAATAGQVGQTVELFTDKELRNRYASYRFKSMTNNGGKLDVALKGNVDFNLTANCSTLPTDGAFLKGNVKYYSKVLSDMATEKCKG